MSNTLAGQRATSAAASSPSKGSSSERVIAGMRRYAAVQTGLNFAWSLPSPFCAIMKRLMRCRRGQEGEQGTVMWPTAGERHARPTWPGASLASKMSPCTGRTPPEPNLSTCRAPVCRHNTKPSPSASLPHLVSLRLPHHLAAEDGCVPADNVVFAVEGSRVRRGDLLGLAFRLQREHERVLVACGLSLCTVGGEAAGDRRTGPRMRCS